MQIVKAPSRLKSRIRQKIRNKAISRAETRILLVGRKPQDFTADELEVIVAEEEEKLVSSIRSKGLLAVLAVLGLSWL